MEIYHQEEIKRLYRPFIFIFLISLLIINWHDISWLFNYRVISAQFSKLLEKNKVEYVNVTWETKDFDYFDKENSIEIPKIGIEAPVVLVRDNNEENLKSALEKGVLLYPDSALPGEQGRTIILGHSAPSGWPQINYDWVFSNLGELETGNEFYIYFNHQRYSYKVIKKYFLARGEEIPSSLLTNSKSMVILLSCWPPGKDQERIAVQAELII